MSYHQNPIKSLLTSINKQSCPYKVNLHCHTTYSDGSLSAIDLYEQANSIGIQNLAITDHHSIRAFLEIQNHLKIDNKNLRNTTIWSGIEISGLLKGSLVHILGFGFDPESLILQPYLMGDSVKGDLLKATSIVSAIRESKGYSFLAHPARSLPANEASPRHGSGAARAGAANGAIRVQIARAAPRANRAARRFAARNW